MIGPELKTLLLAGVRDNAAALIAEWMDYFEQAKRPEEHRYYADFLAFFEECVQAGLETDGEAAAAMSSYLQKLADVIGEETFYNFRESVYTCFLKFPILHDLDRRGGFTFEHVKVVTQFFESLTSRIVLSYIEERRKREHATAAELEEREAPMSAIWDGVLMVTIVGTVDSHRVIKIIDKVLDRLDKGDMRHVIIDIGSIGGVTTEVTNQIIKLNSAINFMGARAYLSGITPGIAKSLTHLDIHLSDIQTYASARDALARIVSSADRSIS